MLDSEGKNVKPWKLYLYDIFHVLPDLLFDFFRIEIQYIRSINIGSILFDVKLSLFNKKRNFYSDNA
jgi:hypothetical protein